MPQSEAHCRLMKWAEMFGGTFLLSILCSLLMLGRLTLYFVKRSNIPAAVVGGIIGLLILTFVRHVDQVYSDNITTGLELLKKNLVNFVFASLILGLSCSRNNSQHSSTRGIITSILHEGMPMVIYNQILTWGQSTVCLFLMCCYNHYDPSIPPLFAAMVPLGLEAGLEINPTRLYRHFWSQTLVEESESLGLMCSILMGIYLIVYKSTFLKTMGESVQSQSVSMPMPVSNESFDRNFGARQQDIMQSANISTLELISSNKMVEKYQNDSGGDLETMKKSKSTNDEASLGVHISFIAISVCLAFSVKFGAKMLEIEMNTEHFALFGGVRLFKLSMCCALICMQIALRYSQLRFKREWFMRLCGLSLDIIVVAALSKSYPRPHMVSERTHYLFCSLFVLACLILNFLCFKFIAKFMFPNFWYERGLVLSADALGHSFMGLLVARSLDPAMTTPVPAAYAYKLMILFIPSTGSKNTIVVTLIDAHGEYVALFVCLLVVSAWYLIFLRFFKHRFVSKVAPLDSTTGNISETQAFISKKSTLSPTPSLQGDNDTHDHDTSLPADEKQMDFDMHFSEKSLILPISQIKEILKWLPGSVASSAWTLRYSLRRDGTSLETLIRLCALTDRAGRPLHSSYVLVIEDSWGYIFGGYIAHAIENKGRYYGNGDSFVFSIAPVLQCYHWTGVNDLFVVSNSTTLAMGGGGEGFAFQLDSELDTGVSTKSDTYGNECLSSSEFFKCLNVEVWDVGSTTIV